LADALRGVVTRDERDVDLLVVGSRPEASDGRVMVSAQYERAIEDSTAPVLVVARGVPLSFLTLAAA
jgi:hypothetical protein